MSNPHTIEGEWTDDTPNLPMTVEPRRGVTIIQTPKADKEVDLSTPESLERAVTQAENLMRFKERVVEMTVKNARAGAIRNEGGVPYFTEKECERMLAMMGGGSVTIIEAPKIEYDEDGSGNFGAETWVRVSHPAFGSFDGHGSAHSTDQFLGTNNGRSSRQLAHVDRHNIKQHALTRAKGSAIRNMLGLHGYTWEDLGKWGYEQPAEDDDRTTKRGKGTGGAGTRGTSGVARKMCAIAKEEGISLNQLSSFAKAMGWYDGRRILDVPDNVAEDLIKAMEESPDDVRAA